RELMATAPELTRNHMEVRGIGIIDVAKVFGIGSIRIEKRLDLVVTLKEWQEVDEVDRIGLDREFYEILALKVPHVTIPVRPGRHVCAHCEPVPLGNLGFERRRGSKRQKYHGSDDAGRWTGIKVAYSLRRPGRRKGHGGVRGTD